MATIPSIGPDEIATLDGDLGRLTTAEQARIRTQTALGDVFWVAVNLALLGFGGSALYGLGFLALRDIVDGQADTWSYIRLLLAATATMGSVRLLRESIGQLRSRRQRRRKRAVRRLLRYLLWWDSPAPLMAATSRYGPTAAALVGLSPFLISCFVAVSVAAYSPWGEPAAEPDPTQAATEEIAPDPSDGDADPSPATATTTLPTTTSSSAPTTTTTGAPTTTTTTTSTTTTQPPAPLMVVSSLTHTFTCNGGVTQYIVAWSVSGDAGGNVNVFRLRSDGFFEQIGFNGAFVANLIDTPPGTGSYQYWLIASNSDNVQTIEKDGFFSSQGTCIG